jgi:uncharacterized membrane protein
MNFICHQIPERSLCFANDCLPLCARCTGIALGLIAGLLGSSSSFFAFSRRRFNIAIIMNGLTLLFPIIDHNWIRFLMGTFLGFSCTTGLRPGQNDEHKNL